MHHDEILINTISDTSLQEMIEETSGVAVNITAVVEDISDDLT